MIIALDTNILIYLFDENVQAPTSKITGRPVDRCRDRVEFLIEMFERENAKIIVPTPSLAEALVRAQSGAPERLRLLKNSKYFRISSFDERAAIEFAATQSERLAGLTRPAASSRTKAKFDDQIVAIAAVEGATIIYSDDADIAKIAGLRFEVLGVEDLPLPPEEAQGSLLNLLSPDDEPAPGTPDDGEDE